MAIIISVWQNKEDFKNEDNQSNNYVSDETAARDPMMESDVHGQTFEVFLSYSSYQKNRSILCIFADVNHCQDFPYTSYRLSQALKIVE